MFLYFNTSHSFFEILHFYKMLCLFLKSNFSLFDKTINFITMNYNKIQNLNPLLFNVHLIRVPAPLLSRRAKSAFEKFDLFAD